MSFVPVSTAVLNQWVRVLGALEKKINRQSFETWLKPTRFSHVDGKTMNAVLVEQVASNWHIGSLRIGKAFKIGERANIAINWEFYNLFNRANFCNSYEQDVAAATFNTPTGYCNGPANGPNGSSGASSAAIPSLHSQFGFRFTF